MTVPATEEAQQAQPAEPQQPVARPVEWAAVPRVNLLPPEILEGRRFRRVQVLLGLVVLAVLALAAGAVVLASGDVTDAQTDLDAANDRVRVLTQRQAQYAEVPRVTAQLDALTAARAQAMANDVSWYRYLADVRAARPTGVSITSLNVTTTTTAPAAAAGTTPLTTTGIGTLAIEGTAPTYDAVSAWLDALDKIPGIDSPQLGNASRSDSTTGQPLVTFSSTAVVTSEALSHLFDEGTAG